MRFALPDTAFPKLHLSKEEERSILTTGDRIKKQTIRAFDDFIAHGRAFPKEQWKLVKNKEQLSAFRTRRGHGSSSPTLSRLGSNSSMAGRTRASTRDWMDGAPSDLVRMDDTPSDLVRVDDTPSDLVDGVSRYTSDSSVDEDSEVPAKNTASAAPMVVVTGILAGTIEDSAYGNVADNESLWKLRNTYIKDDQEDSRILAKIASPSKEDPLHFVGIKWIVKRFAFFTSHRDILYAEDCGVIRDDSGNITMGYHVTHSVDFARLPDLEQFGVRRLRMSLCFLTRKHDDDHVEIFCRAFPQPGGGLMGKLATNIYAQVLLYSCDIMECSYIKKLMWLSQQKRIQRNADSRQSHSRSASHCHMCTKSVKGLGGLFRSTCECGCCKRVVCGKCSVDKKLVIDTEVMQRFCFKCVTEAKQLPAWEVAHASAPSSVATTKINH